MPTALRPPPYAIDERSLEADTRVEVFTAGGPGGQHRNKTQNGVRLHHAPSGQIVSATERRSLEANVFGFSGDLYVRPRDFAPLPLLGMPGATPDNEFPAYYDDTRQFRPLRAVR